MSDAAFAQINPSVNGSKTGWRTVRFDEMAQLVNDRVANPAESGVERYVGLEHLDSESLKIRRWGKPTDVEAQKLQFQPGDIIFGKRRAYQRKVAVADFEGICSAHAMVLRAREEIVVKDFLPFFMQSETFFERALSISVGSLSPTINWKTLAEQKFTIPPKEEQRRIAEILRVNDETIEKWNDCKNSVQVLLTQALQKIFLENLFPKEKLGVHVLQSAYGPRFSNSLYDSNGKFGCIRTTDLLEDGTIVYSSVPRTSLNPEDYQSHILQNGDFLISRSGTCGIAGVFEEQEFPMIPGAFLIRLRLKDSLHPPFPLNSFTPAKEAPPVYATSTYVRMQFFKVHINKSSFERLS